MDFKDFNMVKVSVVVPVYDVRDYLSQCLDSLYSLVDDAMEVILVNDGSTDDSLSICQRYADTYSNTVIIDKENGGLSDARNVGTEVAKGDFVYYLDSDDWLAPNAIKLLYDYAIENDCEIVQGGFYYAYDDHLLYDNKYKSSFVLERNEVMLELIRNDHIKDFAWGKLYRADIVKKHQFPKGKYYEDSYWQHLVVHECNRYGVIPTPLYYYRQRSTGISGEFSLKNLDLLRGYEERLTFVQGMYPEYIEVMVSMLWHLGYSMLRIADHCKDNETRKAFRQYWKFINDKYEVLMKVTMYNDIQYRIWRSFPLFLPVYNFYRKLSDKVKNSKLSLIKN